MGMDGIISDMRAGKQRLQAKYLEAHASALNHFADVAAVETAVRAACGSPRTMLRQPPDAAHQKDSTSAEDSGRSESLHRSHSMSAGCALMCIGEAEA